MALVVNMSWIMFNCYVNKRFALLSNSFFDFFQKKFATFKLNTKNYSKASNYFNVHVSFKNPITFTHYLFCLYNSTILKRWPIRFNCHLSSTSVVITIMIIPNCPQKTSIDIHKRIKRLSFVKTHCTIRISQLIISTTITFHNYSQKKIWMTTYRYLFSSDMCDVSFLIKSYVTLQMV
jgi:hypothetical protein